MFDISKRLSEYTSCLIFDELPFEVVEQTKLFIADYYAACLAGYKINREFNNANLAFIKEMGGSNQASVLFEEKKFPACNAAFMNEFYAIVAFLVDVNKKAAGHIGAHVVSSVFAIGEKLDITWKDIFVAINVGYEIFNRIAGAAQPSLYNKGFHSTGIAGGIACGMACAKLMGLNEAEIYNTMSLCAIQSSGLIIIDESGQGCKPINPANAARAGIVSAELAKRGVQSSRNPLESTKGWFHAYADEIDEDIIFKTLGEKYTICESYLKIYPSCRHTHSCIDAALYIRKLLLEKGALSWIGRIQKIKVYIYPNAIKSAGYIRIPRSKGEAKFSIFYAIAMALNQGRFGVNELDVEYIDDKVIDLINKIELISDSAMENQEKGVRGSRIDVIFDSGKKIEKTIFIPKGEVNDPLSWEDMREKIEMCSAKEISMENIEKFIYNCRFLDMDLRFNSILELSNVLGC